MTASGFLVLLAQCLLLLLAALKLVDLARHRDGPRLDVALLLVSLAVAVGVELLEGRAGDLAASHRVALLALLAQPFLLCRLVNHLQPVVPWVLWLVLAGLAASWALVLFGPQSTLLQAAPLAAYVALATLWAARALVVGASRSQGVVRNRLGLVAAGASVFAAGAALVGVRALFPRTSSGLEAVLDLAALGAAGCYVLGFAPPLWLARAWRLTDLEAFIRASAGSPGEGPDQVLARLCQIARHGVGGLAAAMARWEEGSQRLVLVSGGERAFISGPLPADGLVAGYWRFRRAFVAAGRRQVRQACLRMAPGLDCQALVGVPLVTRTRVWGLLLVFLRRPPLFPDEDLRLLTLLAEHSAVALDSAALVEQLRRCQGEGMGSPAP